MTEPPWSKYHENLLKKWAETCKTYSIMHSLCAQYYNKWNKRLGVPIVILGAVTASSIFSGNENESLTWRYINGSLALVVTALSGVNNFIGTMEKTSKHQNASFKYIKIVLDIDTLLTFARNERQHAPRQFINSKKTEILEIRENVPEVLSWVLADYLKKFDKSLIRNKSYVNNLEINHYPSETESSIHSLTNRSTRSEPIPKNHSDSLSLTVNTSYSHIIDGFNDKNNSKVNKITKGLQNLYPESDIEQNLTDEE